MAHSLLNPIPRVLSFYTDRIAIECDIFEYIILEVVPSSNGLHWKPCHSIAFAGSFLIRSCDSLNALGKATLHIVRHGVSPREQVYPVDVFTTFFYMIEPQTKKRIPILQKKRASQYGNPREDPLHPSFVRGRFLYSVKPHPCIDEPISDPLWLLENIDYIQERLQRYSTFLPQTEAPPPPEFNLESILPRTPLGVETRPQTRVEEVQEDQEDQEIQEVQEDQAEQHLLHKIPVRIASILLQDAETKKDICPISMEPILAKTSSITSCYHIFRTAELLHWNQSNPSCPVCKAIMLITTPSS